MTLSTQEFNLFKVLIYDTIGISLEQSKQSLVQSRLYTRMVHYKLNNFSDYFNILKQDRNEIVHMINLITTNETYFFRESQHFDFLEKFIKKTKINQNIRVWSAASSVGAEAYSIAMILDNYLNMNQWEIIGSDINTEVLDIARKGLYCESWITKIPQEFKVKYCLKGKGKFRGQFIIDRRIHNNITFESNNLTIPNGSFGMFDIVFLRNVLIYFNTEIKQRVLNNIIKNLKVGGYFIISLTENLDGLNTQSLKKVQSSIYQKMN